MHAINHHSLNTHFCLSKKSATLQPQTQKVEKWQECPCSLMFANGTPNTHTQRHTDTHTLKPLMMYTIHVNDPKNGDCCQNVQSFLVWKCSQLLLPILLVLNTVCYINLDNRNVSTDNMIQSILYNNDTKSALT